MINSPRFWYLVGAVLAAGILVLGWFIGAAPLIAQAAASSTNRLIVAQQNDAQRAALASMKGQYENLDQLKSEMARLQLSVPGTDSSDDFIDRVQALAGKYDISIKNITAGEAQPYGASAADPSGAAATAPKTAATPAPSASPTPGATAAPSGPSASTPAVQSAGTPMTPSGPLAADLYTVAIKIVVENTPQEIIPFVEGLQTDARLMLVNSVVAAADPPSTTISGYIFVVHDPSTGAPGALPSATPKPGGTPAPTPAPTGSVTPAPSPSGTASTPGPAPTPTK
jgi:hypothetical protein